LVCAPGIINGIDDSPRPNATAVQAMVGLLLLVIPAQAGIHFDLEFKAKIKMDSGFRATRGPGMTWKN
jgi:hypothetical protein